MNCLALDRSHTTRAVARAATIACEVGGAPLPPGEVDGLVDVLMDDVGIISAADPVNAAHVLAIAYYGIAQAHHMTTERKAADVVIACSDAADAAHLRDMGHEATTLFAFRQSSEREHDLLIAVGLMGHDREGRRNVMSAPLSTRIALIEQA